MAKKSKKKRKNSTKRATRAKSRKPATRKKTTKVAKKKIAARSAAVRTRRARKAPPKPSRLSTSATLVRGVVAGAVATVASKMPGGGGNPDAIDILEREHRHFEVLMKQGEDSTERARATRRELLATLTADLNAHELMEEKVLYPALQSHPQARDIVLEGFEEHHVADLIVKELHDVATDDEAWGAKFKVLKENIEHHIQEEEGNMFRLARGIFSREELRALGARMLKIRR
jgi:hypothetical protein